MSPGIVRRRTAAILTTLSLASSGCVVHSWRPAASATGEPSKARAGDRVRATGSGGAVELTVSASSYPFLTGRVQPGTGPVYVDLRDAARIEISHGGTLSIRDPVTVVERDVVDMDVQVRTTSGEVALHVLGLDAHGVLRGRPLACRKGRGEGACNGQVRVDLRDFDRVETRRVDTGLTIAVATVGLATAGLAAFLGLLIALGGGE